jgi:DNA polymerase-3 subunit epsilon
MTKREIVLDTETTGLDPADGDRIVEIGCIEMENHVPTGREYQVYINPERDMPPEAFKIHGLSAAFLAKHPCFAEVADAFLAFIGDAPLVIHNTAFDLGFVNAELARIDYPPIAHGRAVDTVRLARRRFPGAPANLDALCRRFAIDRSARVKHGALLDAQLLAEVYLQLRGGRQPGLALIGERDAAPPEGAAAPAAQQRPRRPHAESDAEHAAHSAFLDEIEAPIWRK